MPTSPDSELRFTLPRLKRWLVFRQSSRMFLSPRRRLKPLSCLVLGVATLMGAGIGAGGAVRAQDNPSQGLSSELSEVLSVSVDRHPEVLSSAARVCQSLHELGLTTATSRTQLSAALGGNTRLYSHFSADNNGQRGNAEDRAFDVQDRQNIVDLDLNLEHTLYDWGYSQNQVRADELTYQSLQLRYNIDRSVQLAEMLRLASEVSEAIALISIFRQVSSDTSPLIETLEARAQAGFIRLEAVRQAKILELDNRLRLRQAENELAQATTTIQRRYGLSRQQALELANLFSSVRPQILSPSDVMASREIQSRNLEIRGAEARHLAFTNENKPRLQAELTGTLFDIGDFEQEFEVLGGISLSFPLYDGGASDARQAQAGWVVRELRSERQRISDEIISETEGLIKELAERQRILTVIADKLASQREREDSLRALSDRTDISPLELLRLVIQIADSHTQQETQKAAIDRLFIRSLHYADQLTLLLNLSGSKVTC